MPKSNNKNVDYDTHIGIRISNDRKNEYINFIAEELFDSTGKPRFKNLSKFIKYLIDGFIDGTIIEIKDKKELELSTERTRDIIREELKDVKLSFQNLISSFTKQQLEKPEKRNLTYEIFELLGGEVQNLTSTEIAKNLKVKEIDVIKSLNELVETGTVKISKTGKYEVEYIE